MDSGVSSRAVIMPDASQETCPRKNLPLVTSASSPIRERWVMDDNVTGIGEKCLRNSPGNAKRRFAVFTTPLALQIYPIPPKEKRVSVICGCPEERLGGVGLRTISCIL